MGRISEPCLLQRSRQVGAEARYRRRSRTAAALLLLLPFRTASASASAPFTEPIAVAVGTAGVFAIGDSSAEQAEAADAADDAAMDQARRLPTVSLEDSARGGSDAFASVDGNGTSRWQETVERRLAVQTFSNALPADLTALKMEFSIGTPLTCEPYNQCSNTAVVQGIYAGVNITKVTIDVRGPQPCGVNCNVFSAGATNAKLRIVLSSVTSADAMAGGACLSGDRLMKRGIVNNPWAALPDSNSGGATVQLTLANLQPTGELVASSPLQFYMGGDYRICYSYSGNFLNPNADIVPASLQIYGIYDSRAPCVDDQTCLRKRLYQCYIMRESYNNFAGSFSAATSCVVDYSYVGAGFLGPVGVGTWTSAFSSSLDVPTGLVGSVTPADCGSYPESFLCSTETGCDIAPPGTPVDAISQKKGIFQKRQMIPNALVGNKQMMLPPARPDLQGASFKPRTVAACYCPGLGGCVDVSNFLQQVGILHYYLSKVCVQGFLVEKDENSDGCEQDFTGAAPQQRFAVRIECPTDACTPTGDSRIKLVLARVVDDLPAWKVDNRALPASGCGMVGYEAHGTDIFGKNVLPVDLNLNVQAVNGGPRQDVKVFNFADRQFPNPATAGFMFKMGDTDVEMRNFYNDQKYDVCYCDADCAPTGTNWFKVGQIRVASYRLVSAATNVSATANQLALQYVMQPGVLAFARNYSAGEYGILGLQEGGIIKLVADPDQTVTDSNCTTAIYDRNLVDRTNFGFSDTTAWTRYQGRTPAADKNRLVFNSGSIANTITMLQPGTVAVCYCATVQDGGTCYDNRWVVAVRFLIRGPIPGQRWQFSTNVLFRFGFQGYGLTSQDKVRIIPSTSQCSDNAFNPVGAFPVTSIKVQCPDPCAEVGMPADGINGDLAVKTTRYDAYLCNRFNQDCRLNYIRSVVVLDGSRTLLEFESAHLLNDGDFITLEDNFVCDSSNAPGQCNDERLFRIKGQFQMYDSYMGEVNSPAASDYYLLGHKISTTSDTKMVTIPVGWATNAPKIRVAQINGERGKWTRHSYAATAEEVIGTRERREMKVCWKYGGALGQYVTEAGLLTLLDSNLMEGVRVDLTTTVQNAVAPLIVSFTTASAETGKLYSRVTGRTQLKFYFVRTTALLPTFTDSSRIDANTGEDEVIDSRQYICGKLFKELWSSDNNLGFPMPAGCYYKVYGLTRELNMVFDRKNGLAPGQQYQVVINAQAKDEATYMGSYLEVYAMDDLDVKPYESIERGIGSLYSKPQDPAYGQQGVKFLYPDGFKILGGQGASLMKLTGGAALQMQLRGNIDMGGIKPSSILRVYMMPLLHWNLNKVCTAICIPYDSVDAPCGAIQQCKGDALVPSSRFNYIYIRLPLTMAVMTQYVSHTVSIVDLKLPVGGFFATRLYAQLSIGADDSKPDYIESVGDFVWKTPDEGQDVGKLISAVGDGNAKPFKGDTKNVLYATITLATTLFAAVQTNDARMTLYLPDGYTCLLPQDINGSSPWRAEPNLNVFGSMVPQGIGSPDAGDGTRGWSVTNNTCTYSLRQNGIVYAGSSLVIRVTVNNPSFPLKPQWTSNRWQLQLYSKGYAVTPVTFAKSTFAAAGENYSDNAAVLGRIINAKLMPDNFAYSTGVLTLQRARLMVIFQTEQSTDVFSQVQLIAPDIFTFDNPCVAENLVNQYYSVRIAVSTKPLPGIKSQLDNGCVASRTPVNHITISLEGSMRASTYYGFQTYVTNAMTLNADGYRQGWKLVTYSRFGSPVDGTPNTIEFVSVNSTLPEAAKLQGQSFQLCQVPLMSTADNRFSVTFESMMSYDLIRPLTSKVEVRFKVPSGAVGELVFKIVAPEGFTFDFTNDQYLYKTPLGRAPDDTIGVYSLVQADMPGIPSRNGNFMIWKPAFYIPDFQYGFVAFMRIPGSTPTSTIDAFYAGFYNVDDSCFAAAMYHLNPVQAMTNAEVDYSNNIQSKANTLIFGIETTAIIPEAGYILIDGPNDFQIASACVPQAALDKRGPEYEVAEDKISSQQLPSWLICTATVVPGRTSIKLVVPVGNALMPGRYRWTLPATNPQKAGQNDIDETQPCGYVSCWTFQARTGTGTPTDAYMSVPSFDIQRRMVQALLPELTDIQAAKTGRDDRPYHANPLVFVMKLGRGATGAGFLKIRAPLGFEFKENCNDDVDTRGPEVFGTGSLPDGYTPWVTAVTIVNCTGEGPDAYLWVDPGMSLGLGSDLLYPFRIQVFHNPSMQPQINLWSLEYGGESADPFVGFPLWRFTRTSVTAVSSAVSSPITGAQLVDNPVTFTFRPYNTVRGAGMQIKVTAPLGFSIANVLGECSIMMQPSSSDWVSYLTAPLDEAPAVNTLGPPSLLWGQADVDCRVDVLNSPGLLVATVLSDVRELTANRDYQVTIFVNNPSNVLTPDQNTWILETSDSLSDSGDLPTFRDESVLSGFNLNDRAQAFVILNQDPKTLVSFVRGMEAVPGLYFEFRFSSKLERDNVILIQAPTGFMLDLPSAPGQCRNFRWEPVNGAQLYLPETEALGGLTCRGGIMTFRIKEAKRPQNLEVKFRIDTENPTKTPHVMENFWLLKLFVNNQLAASEASLSWEIMPQLTHMRVLLVGDNKAAGSRSAIAISYVPVSDADELYIQATEPVGFDFTGSVALSAGHGVIATDIDSIRIRVAMYSDVQADVVIGNLRLGYGGGQTMFTILTRLSNGLKVDESIDFAGGFRLPGALSVPQQSLISIFQRSPNLYPVASQWPARMGEQATARFTFSLSTTAPYGTMLGIHAPGYSVFSDGFYIFDYPDISPTGVVSSEVVSNAGGDLVARLATKLFANDDYMLQINVVMPQIPNADGAKWSIEMLDDNDLPLDTNDFQTPGFNLVDKVALTIRTNRAPPLSEVAAEVDFDPKNSLPTEALMVAPPGFNFTSNCLAAPGDNNEVLSCERLTTKLAGRATALLRFANTGLSAPPVLFMIYVTTPSDNSVDRSWFIKLRNGLTKTELSWGEDPVGIEVRQMLDTGVVYPAIPSVEGTIALRFITNDKMETGGKIVVGYPSGVVANCDGDAFSPISLQGKLLCTNKPQQASLEILLGQPQPPGSQAFAFRISIPSELKVANFYLLVYSPQGKVQDAATKITGYLPQFGLKVQALPLFWSQAEAKRSAIIGLGFELLEALPEIESNPPNLAEAVIKLPQDFAQLITRASNIDVMALPIPWAKGKWFNATDPLMFRLFFDTEVTTTLKPGRYSFRFPALVPARMPAFNVWMMTLCGPRTPEFPDPCTGEDDPKALVTFPYPGFALDQVNLDQPGPRATGSARRSVHSAALTAAAMLAWLSLSKA